MEKEKIKKYLVAFWKKYFIFELIFLLLILFFLGALAGYSFFKIGGERQQINLALQEEKKDVYLEFLSEIYDKIKQNYWDDISDVQLVNLFKAGSEKLIGSQFVLKSNNKEGLNKMLEELINNLNEAQKKEFSIKLASIVLNNLNPLGRNGLYTTKEEENLKNAVSNINPEKDLYKSLGVNKDASPEKTKEAFEKKVAELEAKAEKSPEVKKELEEVKYAYGIISDEVKKKRYDTFGAEPTVFIKLIRPDILHLYIKRFSPTTLDELIQATNSVDKGEELNTLILDLRGNIGGSLDILPYFLGPFIGQNQYAYDLFHKGEYSSFKTTVGWLSGLVRYKKVVILVDGQTQSTAELMAAVLKKYNVGILVGTKTKGWGTVEKVFNLEHQIDSNEKYSMFLAHSLTIRDDNQPIEGKGVEPAIYLEDPNWEKQLFAYFHYEELNEAVKEIWNKSPADFY